MSKFILYPLFLLLLLMALSGCFRHCYRSRPFCLKQTDLDQNVRQAFKSTGVAAGDIRYEAWWHFFKDPQLNKFIEISLLCHPDIKEAEARLGRAYQEALIVRSALLPHIFAVADIKREKVSTTAPGFVPGAPDQFTDITLELTTARYELDIWRKNRSLYCAALDRSRSEAANFEEAKLLLSTTVAAVYFDLQYTLARKDVTQKRLKARKELYDLHKQRFDLGITSEFRLYQVDTDVQLLEDLVLQLDARIEIDVHALAALVGNVACVCGEKGVHLVEPRARFNEPFPLPVTLPIDLLTRRPDITAQRWLIEAACYDIKAARANFLPRIDLMAFIGFESIKLSRLFTGDSVIALGEVTATLPIFTAGKLQAQLGVAQETLELAIAQYNETVLRAVQQVSDALSNLTIADQREKTVIKAIKDASDLYALTEQKYKNAIFSKLFVLNAFENLYIQKDLEVQIQLARYEAAVDLIRAIGGGYHECCR